MSITETTVEALGLAVAARVPVLLWGAPGTGKTSAITAMSRALGMHCETVIASIREPSDFAGLPVVADGKVVFAPPRWARRLAERERGILFLDEISTAPPAVQAALLRVVLERVVGDLELPEGIVVVAAANPPELAADGWDLAVAGNPTEQRWLAAWKVLGGAAESGADVAALAARVLAKCRPPGVATPAELKLFAPVLRDAGLLAQ